MATAKVIFASMGGNTEEIAEIVGEKLNEKGIDTEVVSVDDAKASDFADVNYAIIASYTYGNGELPVDFEDFNDELAKLDLSGKIYGVVGSGDTSYDDLFCYAVDIFEKTFEKAGAKKGATGVKIEFDAEEEDIKNLQAFVDELIM
ncbi:MAG: flavodoxin [Lactobacillales bacterium]|jgi:flavodoxin short chain|nr:flavodoxin [Lactobacillales bacterium]